MSVNSEHLLSILNDKNADGDRKFLCTRAEDLFSYTHKKLQKAQHICKNNAQSERLSSLDFLGRNTLSEPQQGVVERHHLFDLVF